MILQYNTGNYCNIYNYQYFIYLINLRLTVSFAALIAKVEAEGLTLHTIQSPVLSWNTDNNTAVLNCEVFGYSTSSKNYT